MWSRIRLRANRGAISVGVSLACLEGVKGDVILVSNMEIGLGLVPDTDSCWVGSFGICMVG